MKTDWEKSVFLSLQLVKNQPDRAPLNSSHSCTALIVSPWLRYRNEFSGEFREVAKVLPKVNKV